MKKVLITRKLLKFNEDRISKIWDAKLNFNDEIYSEKQLIELSRDCDGILSSIEDKFNSEPNPDLVQRICREPDF